MVAEAVEPQWAYLRRVIGEVLNMGASAKEIWAQHTAIMQEIAEGDAESAQQIAKEHIDHAGTMIVENLEGDADRNGGQYKDRTNAVQQDIPGQKRRTARSWNHEKTSAVRIDIGITMQRTAVRRHHG